MKIKTENNTKIVILPATETEIKETRRNMEYALEKIASRLVGTDVKVTIYRKSQVEEVLKDRKKIV